MRFVNVSLAVAALATALSATPRHASAQSAAIKVTCKDSTIVTSSRGACTGHGGVLATRTRKALAPSIAKAAPPPIHKTPIPSAPGKVTPTAAETHPIKKTSPPDSTTKARKKAP